jgi:hypothetical protein
MSTAVMSTSCLQRVPECILRNSISGGTLAGSQWRIGSLWITTAAFTRRGTIFCSAWQARCAWVKARFVDAIVETGMRRGVRAARAQIRRGGAAERRSGAARRFAAAASASEFAQLVRDVAMAGPALNSSTPLALCRRTGRFTALNTHRN